jgi:hypothetical protein
MSAISDKIAAIKSSLDAAVVRVTEDVATQTAEIARLQALVDAGGATPEDLANLEALKTELDGLDPIKPVAVPPEVAAMARSRSSRR